MATLSIIQRIQGNTKPLKDTKQAIDDVGRSGGATNSILSRLQSNISSALAGAAKLAKAGLIGLGVALGGAATAGLSFNNSMEQVEAKLFAFLKDGQAVSETLDMIRDRASRTPFAFEDMANATAALIPAAKQSGKEVEELIALAEILAASNPAEGLTGAAFSLKEALGDDFTSIIERFNLPRQRLKQLKEEGVPALEAVRTAMQELGLDADLVTGLSQTATGRLSTVKDKLLGIASRLTQPIFDKVSAGLGKLVNFFDANADSINKFADRIADRFSFLIDRVGILFGALRGGKNPSRAIRTFLTTIGLKMGMTGEAAAALARRINEVFSAVMEVVSKFFGTSDGFLGWYDTLDSLRDLLFSFGLSAGAVDAVEGAIYKAADAFQWLRENVQFKDVLIGLGIAVSSVLLPALAGLVASFLAVAAPIVGAIAAVVLLRTAWEQNWGGIQEKTATAVAFVQGVITQVMTAVTAFWDENGAAIVSSTRAAWEFVRTLVTDVINGVRLVIELVASGILAFWENHGEAIKFAWQNTWEFVKTLVSNVTKIIRGIVDLFLAAVRGDWEGFGEAFTGIVLAIWDTVVSLFTTAAENLLAIVSSLVGDMKTRFSDVNWGELGGNIIGGIKQGVVSAAASLANAVADAARGALNAAKSALGINSPSKLFQDEVGMNIGLGFIPDFSKVRPRFEQAMSGFVSSLPAPRVSQSVSAGLVVPSARPAAAASPAGAVFHFNFTGATFGGGLTAAEVGQEIETRFKKMSRDLGYNALTRRYTS